MIILGIDPGTATTGFGVVKKSRVLKCLNYGIIQTSPTLTVGERLKKIGNEVANLIKKYQPEILAVEKIYFFKNLKTAVPVSQTGGVILLTAAKKKVSVQEFTPLQVKLAITGDGWAEKKKVQKELKSILRMKESPKSDDAADALAIALTPILQRKT